MTGMRWPPLSRQSAQWTATPLSWRWSYFYCPSGPPKIRRKGLIVFYCMFFVRETRFLFVLRFRISHVKCLYDLPQNNCRNLTEVRLFAPESVLDLSWIFRHVSVHFVFPQVTLIAVRRICTEYFLLSVPVTFRDTFRRLMLFIHQRVPTSGYYELSFQAKVHVWLVKQFTMWNISFEQVIDFIYVLYCLRYQVFVIRLPLIPKK